MKTALVTTCWLENKDYRDKTSKWLDYYTGYIAKDLQYDDIILLENGSSIETIGLFSLVYPKVIIDGFEEHLPRTSHLDYPYLWRAVDHFKTLFDSGYDKIIYMDNDFYILSKDFVDRVNAVKSPEWFSPWCEKHNFSETGLQVLTKDSINYRIGWPFTRFLGKTMETTLPVDTEEGWAGDRHSESGLILQHDGWDFSAQVTLDMKMEYKG